VHRTGIITGEAVGTSFAAMPRPTRASVAEVPEEIGRARTPKLDAALTADNHNSGGIQVLVIGMRFHGLIVIRCPRDSTALGKTERERGQRPRLSHLGDVTCRYPTNMDLRL
jgi:hypothetical protein